MGLSSGAAYRIRTGDLRITRSQRHHPEPAACIDSATRIPECTRRTVCSGLPVHDPVHG